MIVTSRVRKITKKKVPTTKVYDLEVPKYSNFMLANGMIVHNSKDISDGVTGALYGATTNSSEPTSVDIISRANEAILNELANDSKNESVYNAPNKSALDQQLFSSLSDILDEFF